MSVLFWALAGLMIVVAVAFIALPLWRRGRGDGDLSTERVDVALYHQRRAELDQELDAGLLTRQAHERALAELDRQLLLETEDTGTAGSGPRRFAARWWPAAVTAVTVPLVAVALYLEVGGGGAALDGEGRTGAPDIEVMVQRLEDRLEDQPDDGEGWLMLGRSYAVMGRPEEAVRALSRAQRLLGDTPDVLVTYAQALAATREQQSFRGRPAELVDRALEQAPNHPQALWLSGVAAVEGGDYETAADRWKRLLTQLPPDGEDTRVVRRNLEAVRERMGGAESQAAGPRSAMNEPAPSADAALRVDVTLAPGLRERADPGDTVFVFARAVNGPPMPLAVVKRRVRDLPATVTLDDSASMMEGRGISGHDRVTVIARISKSGDAAARPGDLESGARTVPVAGDEAVPVTIDTVVE